MQLTATRQAYPQILILAVVVVLALFMWQGNKGFSLWDEGYLWYGAQRVIQGEVPILDFKAYDPGRYYWSAAFMNLLGDKGIMSLRTAVAIFQALGLSVGILLIASAAERRGIAFLLLSSVTLIAWMFPRHKLFDISLSIFLVGVLAFLVQSPTMRRYFLSGMCVGLVAVFGRNHGVYGFAGSLGVMLWLYINRTVGPPVTKGLAIWGLGVVAGFMPIVLMALSIPGFANAFIESIRFLIEFKGTNLPLPVPWPWSVDFGSMPIHDAVGAVLVGLFFVAVAGFGTLSAPWITWQAFRRVKVSSALVAASFMGLPYAHYAYSRADPGHLAQGIFPFLIGSLALLAPQSAKLKWPLTLGLCFASLWVMQMHQPGWQCALDGQCVEVKISGNSLLVSPDTAGDIELLRNLAHQYAPNGRSFVATPFWPGAYALLERRSPTWDIYPLFSRSEAFEQAEIARMSSANPGFVLVLDLPLDGREDLRFKNTHPLTHQYIVDNFRRLAESPSEKYQIFAERSTSH